ncbi:MAG: quinone oxidoreductase [Pseudomonadota bacterium]
MSKELAMQIHQYGDTDQIRPVEFDLSPPGPGEVRIRHTVIGVNFVDVYHRTGLYPLRELPATLGVEAAGIIEAIGPEVSGLSLGQRVAYAGVPAGAYTTARNMPADRVIALPDNVADADAASSLLRGITAHMLFQSVRTVHAGDSLLIHAAAGGLGQVLGQWLHNADVTLIGTVGSAKKAELALSKGYHHVVEYKQDNFVDATLSLTAGRGVHYAVDGIGGATLRQTLQTVRPFGMVASVGQAAGRLEDKSQQLSLAELGPERCIALSRPSVVRYMSELANYREGAQATVRQLQRGLKVDVSLSLPLQQAASAHRQLEAGQTSGAVLLRP